MTEIVLTNSRTEWCYQGEYGIVTLKIDVSDLIADYPSGTANLIFTDPNGKSYLHTAGRSGSYVTMVLNEADTQTAGICLIVLTWTGEEFGKRTRIYEGIVKSSITTYEEQPTEAELGYIEQMQTIGNEVVESAAEVKEISETAKEAIEAAKTDAISAIDSEGDAITETIAAKKDSAVNAVTVAGDEQKAAVNAAGEDAVENITAEKTSIITAIDNEGDIVKNAVAAEKTSAVNAVTAAGDEQKAAVKAAGDEQMDIIGDATSGLTKDVTAVKSDIVALQSTVSGHTTDIADLQKNKQDTISDIETIRSGATLGTTAVQTETDPTVPDWAKTSTKPTYTADEVGAVPNGAWELVESIQIDQDTTSVYRSETPSGAQYQYRKIAIGILTTGLTSSTAIGFGVNSTAVSYSNAAIRNTFSARTDGKYYILFETVTNEDNMIFQLTFTAGNNADSPNASTVYNATRRKAADIINNIFIVSYTEDGIKAGSIINIYGVK